MLRRFACGDDDTVVTVTDAGDAGKADAGAKQDSGMRDAGGTHDAGGVERLPRPMRRAETDGGSDAQRRVTIAASEFKFVPNRITASPGEKMLIVDCATTARVPHNSTFDLPGGEKRLKRNVAARLHRATRR